MDVCYPGQTSTSVTRSVTPEMMQAATRLACPLFKLLVRLDGGKSASKASRSSVFLSCSAEVAGVTGAYFDRTCQRVDWPRPVLDTALRGRLWSYLEDIIAASPRGDPRSNTRLEPNATRWTDPKAGTLPLRHTNALGRTGATAGVACSRL